MNIHVEHVLNHPPARVWAALTDPAAMARWLMPNDFRPEVGHRFTFQTDPAPGFDGTVHCEVLELVPAERLRLSWRAGRMDTVVTFALAAAEGGRTRLTLDHDGFGMRDLIARVVMGGGWRRILRRKLPAAIADGADAPVPTPA